ncbi:hypothetical protein [Bacillus cereus]|uniref:hypothetical protein n=1 Tax=Bacillus cereus TaxID=1396 RepID=UPI001C8C4911|nr:hypothetical protein [Bacillus cereus]MBX9158605.1 hypothetical protein [Bacillus cereus]
MGFSFTDAKENLVSVLQSEQLTEDGRKNVQEVIDLFDKVVKRKEDKDRVFAMGVKLTNESGVSGLPRLFSACQSLFGSVPKQYELAVEDLETTQRLQEDILHSLELDKDVDFEQAGKDLNAIRQHRRHAKDYIELTKPIWELAKKHEGILNELAQVQGHVRQVKEKHAARVYTPRELSSLAVAFKLASAPKEEEGAKGMVLQKE